MPAAVGAGELDVSERRRRVEGLDESSPAERDAVEAELIVDESTGAHSDGARGDDVKVEERRGDALEVSGVGEEGEDLFTGAGQKERPFETIGHCTSRR
jgi:hypothetical protein